MCTCASRLLVGGRTGTSEHGLASKERGLSLVQRPSLGHDLSKTSAARRAQAASARAGPPPERESERSGAIACAHTRKRAVWETAAGSSQHGLAPKGGGLSLVQWPFIGHEPTTTSAARRARSASARAAPPLHRERARWRDRVCAHAQAGCSSEAAAGTSEHGLAPKERALSLVQCPSLGHAPTTTSAARRACAR